MSVKAVRMVKNSYVSSAFSGEGARLYGGRWNSVGTRVVYAAGSLSLAILELLVHTDDYSTIENLFSYIVVEIPSDLIERVGTSDLPRNWDSSTPNATTQQYGDRWIKSMRSAVLSVPSAVTRTEQNYLLNPVHSDFANLLMQRPVPFDLDQRLIPEK